MRILQLSKFYPPTMGGIELVAKMFSRAHIEHKDKVNVISFGADRHAYVGEFGEEVNQIKTHFIFASAPVNLLFFLSFKKYIKKNKIDKIYVHLPNPYMHHLVWWYRKFLIKQKIKISAIYHSDLVNQKVLGPIYDKYFKLTMKIYDEVISSSENLINSSNILKLLNKDIRKVIPFCSDGEVQFKLRSQFNKKLVAIGRMVPYKGFEFLIKAINNSEYNLTIIGDGPLRKELEAICASNVKLVGKVSEKEKWKILDQSDLLIMSSINRAEAYGMIIVEAFEAGLPVVAANINSGVTYLAKTGERAEIFEIGSHSGLLEALEKFNINKDLISTYSKSCREFFEAELSYERFKERVYKLDR